MTVLWIVLILLSVALALGYVLIQRRRRRLDDHLQALAESVASRGLDLGREQDYDKVVDELTNRYDKKELRQLYQHICRRWGKAQDATLRLRQQPAHQGYGLIADEGVVIGVAPMMRTRRLPTSRDLAERVLRREPKDPLGL